MYSVDSTDIQKKKCFQKSHVVSSFTFLCFRIALNLLNKLPIHEMIFFFLGDKTYSYMHSHSLSWEVQKAGAFLCFISIAAETDTDVAENKKSWNKSK